MRHVDLIYKCIHSHSLMDAHRFGSLYELLQKVKKLKGAIAELGVFKGGTSLGFALIAPEKVLHLFDTFRGLREPLFEEFHKQGDFSDTSEDSVRALFGPAHHICVHAGWFPETVSAALEAEQFCFVHVDAAYYESTRDAIAFFFPRLSKGGVMVFDDWNWLPCPGVRRALLEGRETHGYTITVLEPSQAFITKD